MFLLTKIFFRHCTPVTKLFNPLRYQIVTTPSSVYINASFPYWDFISITQLGTRQLDEGFILSSTEPGPIPLSLFLNGQHIMPFFFRLPRRATTKKKGGHSFVGESSDVHEGLCGIDEGSDDPSAWRELKAFRERGVGHYLEGI